MCGIVGIIHDVKVADRSDAKKLFTDLIVHDTIRGAHSTGVFCVPKLQSKAGKAYYHKKAIPGWDFQHDPVFKDYANNVDDYKFMIGHNRLATTGKINYENSHPFHRENVIGVHNGTIRNKAMLPDGNKFDVDSDAVFNAINEWGVEKTISTLDGAFSLVWYDLVEQKLKIIRNSERPLSMMYDDKSGIIGIASEAMMLDWLFTKNSFFDEIPREFKKGFLYEFPWDDPFNYTKRELELKKSWQNKSQGWSAPSGKGQSHHSSSMTSTSGNGGAKWHKVNRLGGDARIKRLERSGYRFEEEVLCLVDNTYTYSEDSYYCCVHATTVDNLELPVIIHGIHKDIVDKHDLENQFIKTKVLGASFYNITDKEGQDKVLLHGDQEWEIVDDKDDKVIDMFVKTPVRKQIPHESPASDTSFDPDDPASYVESQEGEKDKFFLGPNREFITKDEFERQVQSGCIMCPGNIQPEDHNRINWTYHGDPVCESCTQQLKDTGQDASLVF